MSTYNEALAWEASARDADTQAAYWEARPSEPGAWECAASWRRAAASDRRRVKEARGEAGSREPASEPGPRATPATPPRLSLLKTAKRHARPFALHRNRSVAP